jgi:hypothetical protein
MNLTPLPMPIESPLWALGEFRIERPELREFLGEPHFVETDGLRTYGGEEDQWAFVLPSGQWIAGGLARAIREGDLLRKSGGIASAPNGSRPVAG